MRSTLLTLLFVHYFLLTSSPTLDEDHDEESTPTPPPPPPLPPPHDEAVASANSDPLEPNPESIVPSMLQSATDEAQEWHTPQQILNPPTSTTSFNNNMDHQHNNNVDVQTIRLRVFCVNPCNPDQLERLGVDSLPATQFQCDQHIFIDIPFDLIQNSFQFPKPPISVKLGKTFLGLTYQAVVAFMVFQFQGTPIFGIAHGHSNPITSALLFCIAEVAVVMGFTACLIGILLRESYTAASVMIEQAGCLAAAFGFFVMMGMFLTRISQWIGWLCGGASLVAFFLAFKKIKTS